MRREVFETFLDFIYIFLFIRNRHLVMHSLFSILFLSIGNNKLSNTFIAYADSYNLDKRVIRQFELADYKIYRDSDTLSYEEVDTFFSTNELLNPDKKDILKVNSFLKNAWVNREMSDRESYPQIFALLRDFYVFH